MAFPLTNVGVIVVSNRILVVDLHINCGSVREPTMSLIIEERIEIIYFVGRLVPLIDLCESLNSNHEE